MYNCTNKLDALQSISKTEHIKEEDKKQLEINVIFPNSFYCVPSDHDTPVLTVERQMNLAGPQFSLSGLGLSWTGTEEQVGNPCLPSLNTSTKLRIKWGIGGT